jgi:phosphatidate cytidylyltransferase
MLRYRLLFGTIMTVFFAGIVTLDGRLDGSLTFAKSDDKAIQATIFCILVALLAIPANLEMAKLASINNIRIFVPVSIPLSMLFATGWYWLQFIQAPPGLYFLILLTFMLLVLPLYQYKLYGLSGVLANCGATCFTILYLGLLSGFCIAIRTQFGLWWLFMFIFVVKSCDIGAFTGGKLFGKHKFSPKISPGKTWEGMTGGVIASVIIAVGFALVCDIMDWWAAIIFGVCMAFIGQFGDLAESMLKRDAGQKDSASLVPGFGGVLDIIDSTLVAAPFAYLFFMVSR